METRWDWLSYENADSFEWDSGRTPFTSIAVPMGGAALYLALISALMIWRHNKSKIDTTRVTQLHNLILVVISVILSYGVWSEVKSLSHSSTIRSVVLLPGSPLLHEMAATEPERNRRTTNRSVNIAELVRGSLLLVGD